MTTPKKEDWSLSDMERVIDGIGRMNGGNGAAHVSIQAGSVGVWIATTACIVMVACTLFGALWVSNEFRRYDDEIAALKDRDNVQTGYIQAIYRAAPHLKPEEK